MSDEQRPGNPAVLGLAAFGITTLTLQFHNLGLIGLAPVIWLGLVLGGSCQLMAGLMEFRTGNNFGFVAFCGYPAAAARRTRPPARTPCAPARLRGRAPS